MNLKSRPARAGARAAARSVERFDVFTNSNSTWSRNLTLAAAATMVSATQAAIRSAVEEKSYYAIAGYRVTAHGAVLR